MKKENHFKELADMIKEDFKKHGGVDERGYYIQGIKDKLYIAEFVEQKE